MILRAYRAEDDAPLTALLAAAHGEDSWSPAAPASLPAGDPRRDHCVVALDGHSNVVGLGSTTWWTERQGLVVYLTQCAVAPAHTGQGVGTALLGWQERAAAQRAGELAENAVLAANAEPGHPAWALLATEGYRIAFTLVHMRLEAAALASAVRPEGWPPGLSKDGVRPDDLPEVGQVLLTAFADSHLGFEPDDVADTLAAARRDPARLARWRVAREGDRIVAIVIHDEEDGTIRTPWVATLPSHRGRGLASSLMAESLADLFEGGLREALLSTIAENPHDTVGLYERLGYRITRTEPRLRKPMRP